MKWVGSHLDHSVWAPSQRVLYSYWLDANFGLMYLRRQTYFSDTMHVYGNGHNWLARQMTRWRLGFVQHDNAFVELDHP